MSVMMSFTVAGEDAAKLKEKVRELALQEGLSMSEWIVDAIVEKIRNNNG